MTSAQILAIAGTLSSLLAMLSGFLNQPILIGLSGAVMLSGNGLAFYHDWKLRRMARRLMGMGTK